MDGITASPPALFGRWGKVPLKPFAGTIGLALAEPGLHSIVPPRRVGGNMDVRDLSRGTELFLPIEVQGALFSVGDTHAAQGDGEVCGTANRRCAELDRVVLLSTYRVRISRPRSSHATPIHHKA